MIWHFARAVKASPTDPPLAVNPKTALNASSHTWTCKLHIEQVRECYLGDKYKDVFSKEADTNRMVA